MTKTDTVLAALSLLVVFSLSDMTAWIMAKVPILREMPRFLWSNPRLAFLVFFIVMIFTAYLSAKYNSSVTASP